MKLINKAALIAEIDRLQNTTMDEDKNFLSPYHEGIFDGLSMIDNFLDTLEVKEVNFEKEYDNEFFKDPVFGKLVNRNAGISIAKHFFELGLKARKEAEK